MNLQEQRRWYGRCKKSIVSWKQSWPSGRERCSEISPASAVSLHAQSLPFSVLHPYLALFWIILQRFLKILPFRRKQHACLHEKTHLRSSVSGGAAEHFNNGYSLQKGGISFSWPCSCFPLLYCIHSPCELDLCVFKSLHAFPSIASVLMGKKLLCCLFATATSSVRLMAASGAGQ